MSGTKFLLFSLKVFTIKSQALLLVKEFLDSPDTSLGGFGVWLDLLIVLFRGVLGDFGLVLERRIGLVVNSLHNILIKY